MLPPALGWPSFVLIHVSFRLASFADSLFTTQGTGTHQSSSSIFPSRRLTTVIEEKSDWGVHETDKSDRLPSSLLTAKHSWRNKLIYLPMTAHFRGNAALCSLTTSTPALVGPRNILAITVCLGVDACAARPETSMESHTRPCHFTAFLF